MNARTVVIAGLFVIGAVSVSGQPQRNPATLDDLVVEIRGLRADLSRTAGASMRMQLLTARLTLQEQRISALAAQDADVLTRLTAATRQRTDAEEQMKRWQTAIDARDLPPEMPRAEAEAHTEGLKRMLSQFRGAEQQLRQQEAGLAAQIVAEQGRWTDFNGRLDDLERSLAVAAPR
jgi:predicted  nucleic acid-binding Zn-ribbon protein